MIVKILLPQYIASCSENSYIDSEYYPDSSKVTKELNMASTEQYYYHDG